MLTAQTKVFSSLVAVAVFSEAVAVFSTLVAIAAPFDLLNASPIHLGGALISQAAASVQAGG